jgi:hypothetical protein
MVRDDVPAEHRPNDDVLEEADSVRGDGDSTFGNSTIEATTYECATHGVLLSQDVMWKNGEPHCPYCGQPLTEP